MSKKNVFLILVIIIFLTIMAMSVWGKKPEMSSRIVVSEVSVLDTLNNEITNINNSQLKEKKVEFDYKDNITSYTFSVRINPVDATDLSLNYDILVGSDYVTLTELSFDAWKEKREKMNILDEFNPNYHYFIIEFDEEKPVTICFETNKTDVKKTDYIMFNFTGVKHDDIIDI